MSNKLDSKIDSSKIDNSKIDKKCYKYKKIKPLLICNIKTNLLHLFQLFVGNNHQIF